MRGTVCSPPRDAIELLRGWYAELWIAADTYLPDRMKQRTWTKEASRQRKSTPKGIALSTSCALWPLHNASLFLTCCSLSRKCPSRSRQIAGRDRRSPDGHLPAMSAVQMVMRWAMAKASPVSWSGGALARHSYRPTALKDLEKQVINFESGHGLSLLLSLHNFRLPLLSSTH